MIQVSSEHWGYFLIGHTSSWWSSWNMLTGHAAWTSLDQFECSKKTATILNWTVQQKNGNHYIMLELTPTLRFDHNENRYFLRTWQHYFR